MTGARSAIQQKKPRPQLNRKLAALARGARAEIWAALWLRLKGYKILARRHRDRFPGAGEIDIIAKKGGVVAFIEVKTRKDAAHALAAITPRQRRRLEKGAEAFLAARPALSRLGVRFDAIWLAPGRWPHHMIDAWRQAE